MVLYVISHVLGLLLVLFTIKHCQFGVGFTLYSLLIVLVLYHLIATALGAFLILMNDGCHHIERIAVAEVSTSVRNVLVKAP